MNAHSTPRARRRDANQGRILEAAMGLVAEGGLEALSMAKLADAADYTAGALYRYFPSKDALLAAMVGQVLDEVQVFLLEDSGGARGPLARIFSLARAYHRFSKARPNAFGLLSSTLAEPRILLAAEAASPVHERAIAVLEQLAAALGEATAAGELHAPPNADGGELERTLVLFATLQGLLQLGKQARFVPSLADAGPLVDHAVATLLLGWGAHPKHLTAEMKS